MEILSGDPETPRNDRFAHSPRARIGLPEMPGEGAAGSLPIGRRPGRRSRPLRQRRAVASPAAERAAAVLGLDAPAARPGRSLGRAGALLPDRGGQLSRRVRRLVRSRGRFAGRCVVDHRLDHLPTVVSKPTVDDPGMFRMGHDRLAGAVGHSSPGLRRRQFAGGGLPADHCRLGPVVSRAVRLVHHVAVTNFLRRPGARLSTIGGRGCKKRCPPDSIAT